MFANESSTTVLTTIPYFDSLGRPAQQVQKGVRLGGQDLVRVREYGCSGRYWMA